MDYDKLLDRAMKKVPKVSDESERLKIPEPSLFLMGSRTVISNFTEIANAIRRKPEHLQKYLLKELATKGELNGSKLIVQGKFGRMQILKKFEQYYKEYVFCPDCKKPDTKIIKEDRLYFIKCEACGSKHVVKKV